MSTGQPMSYMTDESFQNDVSNNNSSDDNPKNDNDQSQNQQTNPQQQLPFPVSINVVFGLIECRDWEGVLALVEAAPEAAKLAQSISQPGSDHVHNNRNNHHPNSHQRNGTNTSSSSSKILRPVSVLQGNLPLHEVCKQQPPLEVVDFLLELYPDAAKTPGKYGYLPLHYACSTNCSADVVARLIEVHPAATRCRDELDDALPIHLAAQWGASEDVMMEILTAHPEGSVMRDAAGRTPLDHAKRLPATSEIRQAVLSSLETAPILVATAKAATARLTNEYETKLAGMQEAHAEYVRQLEERQEEEKTCFLEMEVQFHNALAEEKERNILLAEKLIEFQRKEEELVAERNEARILLESEREEAKHRDALKERELRTIIDSSMDPESEDHAENGRNKDGEEKDSRDVTETIGATTASLTSASCSSSTIPIPQQVGDLAKQYSSSKRQLAAATKDLQYNQNMVHHLNQLLSSKDQQIQTLKQKLDEKESAKSSATKRADTLATLQDGTQSELQQTREQLISLQEQTETQQQELIEANRLIHVQESRLGSIKSLVASLAYNIDSWATDDEWEAASQKIAASTRISSSQSVRSQVTPPKSIPIATPSPPKKPQQQQHEEEEEQQRNHPKPPLHVVEGMERVKGRSPITPERNRGKEYFMQRRRRLQQQKLQQQQQQQVSDQQDQPKQQQQQQQQKQRFPPVMITPEKNSSARIHADSADNKSNEGTSTTALTMSTKASATKYNEDFYPEDEVNGNEHQHQQQGHHGNAAGAGMVKFSRTGFKEQQPNIYEEPRIGNGNYDGTYGQEHDYDDLSTLSPAGQSPGRRQHLGTNSGIGIAPRPYR